MEKLAAWSIRSRFWIILVTIGIVVIGLYSASELPIDAVPDITNVQVMINSKTGALAPEEIENSVTFPVETEISGLPGVEEIRSISKYGLSQVIVIFKDGTDIYFARQLINERLQNLRGSLPEGVSPILGPVSTGLGEVLMYVVQAKAGSALASRPETERLRYLRTVQDWKIRPFLKGVQGVAEVDSNGGYVKAIHIKLNPFRMERHGVSMDRIEEALTDIGMNHGGGYMENQDSRFIMRISGRFDAIDEIRRIPVRIYALGNPIQLSDIADVQESNQPRLGAATYAGRETVLGTVLMRIGANSRTVAEESTELLNHIVLPPDVEIEILYSRSNLVNATIRTVMKNLLEGGFLVIAVLLLILGNFRAAIIVSLAIPLSMLVSLTGMLNLKISANLMSLGAIDFGLLVDGSVVMIENIVRKLEESHGKILTFREKIDMILESAKEVAAPLTSGLLVIIAVYVPILSLTGIEGKMFRPMAWAVLFALVGSLVTALVLMPVLAFIFLKPPRTVKENRILGALRRIYRPALDFSLEKKSVVVIPSLMLLVFSVLAYFSMGSDFIPKLDEGDMVIGLVRRPDIGLAKSIEMQLRSEEVIRKYPEVKTVFSRIGTPESDTDPMGVNFSDTFLVLNRPDEMKTEPRSRTELFEAISADLEKIVPGQSHSPTQPIEMRFNEMLEGSRADVNLRIYGSDLKKLAETVEKIMDILGKIPGVSGVGMDELTALRISPVIDYKINHARLSGYGMHVESLNRAFSSAMAGSTVGYFYEEVLRFPIVLRMDEHFRNDTNAVSRIPVELPGGGVTPLSELAQLRRLEQVTTIARSGGSRYASVAVYLGDRDVQSFVTEANEKIQASGVPKEFTLVWGGQFKNLQKARLRLALIVPATLLVIFIILLRSFNSFKQTLLIYSCIPFILTGGILFLFARGIPLSISAAVGFIALTGIAILNGTVLVNFFNQLRASGKSVRQSVTEGTLIRLRPILMTALVASLGFIPMAFNTGPGSEVQRPLATVVIGGLILEPLLTLLLLPILYNFVEGAGENQIRIPIVNEMQELQELQEEEILEESPKRGRQRRKNA